MRFLVAVKQVPDTTLIDVDENGNMKREGVPSILDPYSEHALETALALRKEGDIITVVTMGPPQAANALRVCLELGADEAYLLSDRAFAGADVHATSRTLSAFVEKFACDSTLLLFGKQAADGDTAQVPAEVAEMLGRQQFCYCINVDRQDDGFTAVQDYGDEIRTCRVPEGSVISVSEGSINRGLPSIARFMKVSGMEIKTLDRIALGLGNYSVGMNGSRTKIVRSMNVRSERTGKVVDGSDPVKAAEYIRGLL
ncbi:MAG: electron transfer flavoprotein subunit beta/FixA family protein [Candidatus Methanomethylophilus sp.]|nr:electron transfer flavoprotein subunit beta/FixA family protein [Methanomethylophilus sp.]